MKNAVRRPGAAFAGVALLYAGTAGAMCVQDQYGNQYNFVVDTINSYVYGSMISAQGCDAPTWYLTGSYYPDAGPGPQYELTAANPLGDADSSCIATYKIKGTYPNGAWYYTSGYGGQEFTFVSCGVAGADVGATTGGTRR